VVRQGTASESTTPTAGPRPIKAMRDPSSSPRTSHAVRIPMTGTSRVKEAAVETG
jgi:hypothetical protein